MTINLLECKPLNASITPKQCKANQQRGVWACEKCKGDLGMPVQLQPIKEKEDMTRPAIKSIPGVKKGDKFDCPECGRKNVAYESKGKCGQCNTWERLNRKSEKKTEQPNNSQTLQKMPLSAVVEPEQENTWEPEELSDPSPVDSVPANFGKVTNGDGKLVSFGVDELIWHALGDAWNTKKNEWMVELSGVKPTSAVCRCAQMVKAVEQLGY